ncbi:MAG: hypothetical protein KC635_02580 [Myxococcales bacterium]|nr:hypothetical protein [Myxococcales bacterium]MCB9731053.1 hypothetical protein [Deltaproteobacteria bacterium]
MSAAWGLRRAPVTALAPLLGLALVGAAGCASAPERSPRDLAPRDDEPPAWQITARPDADLDAIEVVACFRGASAPLELVPGSQDAGRYLLTASARDAHGAVPLDKREDALGIPRGHRDVCVSYAIDVGGLTAGGSSRDAYRAGRDVVLATDLWLWRPRRVDRGARAWVTLELPEGVRAAVPWPAVATRPGTYALDASAFRWRGLVAFGRAFETLTVAVGPRSRLDVAVLDGDRRATAGGIARWLGRAAGAVAATIGEFPRERVQVLVVPTSGGDDPVPFGYVVRGGGATVTLLLDRDARDEALDRDWVAPHELFHLAMPPIRSEDSWLSEGFTMYYTELLRGRAGLVTPREAWEALDAGFDRGYRDGTGRSLADESRDMRETYAFKRVYWAGAALALLIDLELRQRAEGRFRSLDDAMVALFRAGARADRFWTAREVVAELDELGGTDVFARTTDAWLDEAEFPVLTGAYEALGLRSVDGELRVDPERGRALRDAIISAP